MGLTLYTIQETAEILRMSRGGVLNLVKRGMLPSVQVPGLTPKRPGRILIDAEDLTDYVKNRWKNGDNL